MSSHILALYSRILASSLAVLLLYGFAGGCLLKAEVASIRQGLPIRSTDLQTYLAGGLTANEHSGRIPPASLAWLRSSVTGENTVIGAVGYPMNMFQSNLDGAYNKNGDGSSRAPTDVTRALLEEYLPILEPLRAHDPIPLVELARRTSKSSSLVPIRPFMVTVKTDGEPRQFAGHTAPAAQTPENLSARQNAEAWAGLVADIGAGSDGSLKPTGLVEIPRGIQVAVVALASTSSDDLTEGVQRGRTDGSGTNTDAYDGFGILIFDDSSPLSQAGYLLEVRCSEDRVTATAHAIVYTGRAATTGSGGEGGGEANGNAVASSTLDELPFVMPMLQDSWLPRATQVVFDETAVASAFTEAILDHEAGKSSGPTLEVDEATQESLDRVIADLLRLHLAQPVVLDPDPILTRRVGGDPTGASPSAGVVARLVAYRFVGVAESVKWANRLFGSDGWGLIQLFIYIVGFAAVGGSLARLLNKQNSSLHVYRIGWLDRFFVWAATTGAFVGTVYGISAALSLAPLVLNPNTQARAVILISNRLGTAFDTTFVGLLMSLVAFFAVSCADSRCKRLP